ncbi:surface polysaccharide O-acyltransferase-like enzyme [Planomicrobium soli]|uniref:Surface polysaccharide O-acyltransferase-like enzyme n=1 Tax=Planomicrobium soli TaxID=1176648 RepID=A0A2P8H384_9BACL|nr:acyltransferase family protein [Planomicrobium soli]PSL40663.1 surface polysaccharide O-acyltransferase-like enzyme [Planomicrobium soli]
MNRFLFLDWLRILATLAVVTLHSSTSFVLTNFHEDSFSWLVGNFYESITRWCVPVFVMISGALLLNDVKTNTYKSFLSKRLSKVLVPLLGWSIIYYGYFVFQGRYSFSLLEFAQNFSTNKISNHFWFIYMLLGLYLITPLLKILVQNATKRDIKYFLLLWFYASIMVRLLNFYFGFSFNVELYFATSFIGYYLLGYYLMKYEISLNWRKAMYISGLIGVLATFFLTYSLTIEADGKFKAFWYDYHSITVLAASVGLFVFMKYSAANSIAPSQFLAKLINETSFGIYLAHILVMKILATYLPFLWLDMNTFIEIPYKVLLTVFVSILLVKLMKKVVLLRKLVP